MKTYEFSLIIPTRNRPKEIADVFADLDKQNATFEVILFNDGENEEVKKIAEQTWSFDVVYLSAVDSQNGCYNRNRCLEKARGAWIVFLDDDLRIEPYFLDWVRETGLRYASFTPRIILPPEKTKVPGPFKRLSQFFWTGKTIPFAGFFVAGFDQERLKTIAVDHMVGATMIFRSDLVKDVRWDEWIGEGTGYLDDSDFTHKVRMRHGVQHYFVPTYTMMHLQAGSGGYREHDVKRWFYYYQAHKIYFIKQHYVRFTPLVVLVSFIEAVLRSFQKKTNLLPVYAKATRTGLSQNT